MASFFTFQCLHHNNQDQAVSAGKRGVSAIIWMPHMYNTNRLIF